MHVLSAFLMIMSSFSRSYALLSAGGTLSFIFVLSGSSVSIFSQIFFTHGFLVLISLVDRFFMRLSSTQSLSRKLSIIFNFLVKAQMSDFVSKYFPLLSAKQNVGDFERREIWDVVRSVLDKLRILTIPFVCVVMFVVSSFLTSSARCLCRFLLARLAK